VPFCRQTPLRLKALRARDYSQNPQSLGEHLKKRRRQLGLLQREAAERMGIQRDTYVNWEKDKTGPVASQFRPVVAFLGYDPHTRGPNPRRPRFGQTTGVGRELLSSSKVSRLGRRDPNPVPQWNMAYAAVPSRPPGRFPRSPRLGASSRAGASDAHSMTPD
jgi:DNA-binding XRE family transcriptional regulator